MAEKKKKENKEKEKKIIVDEDWKEQARREKEVLTAQEQMEREKTEKEKRRGPLPPGNFTALVNMLTTQVMFALGLLVPKGQEKVEPDLEMAKYHIDILEALEGATKGNLSEQEEKLLTEALHQVRMLYVKVSG